MKGCATMKGGGIWIKQSWVLPEVKIKAKGGIRMKQSRVAGYADMR